MKRTKRKNVTFSEEQWKTVRNKASWVKLNTTALIRNLSLYRKWKYTSNEHIGLRMHVINQIGTNLAMILRVAEKTDSEYTDKLRELKKRYDAARMLFYGYYEQYQNRLD